jgi:ribosomal protein S18 acetylase RimI-like enzyme
MHSKLPKIEAQTIVTLNALELEDLCDATIATMQETSGFTIGTQSIDPIEKAKIMSYWEGVLLIPERILIVGRFDGAIAGSVQVIIPSPNNHTSKFACSIDNHFVAPWARGHGLSNLLLECAEEEAKKRSLSVIKLSVRETRTAAIRVFEKRGYIKWGVLPKYEFDKGKVVAGYFYYKEL